MSDDLFREVDEEVRQQQYLELWKKYGVYIAGVVVVVVLITVGFVFWRDSQQAARDASGEQLLAAINIAEEQTDQALDQFAKGFVERFGRRGAGVSHGPPHSP